MTLGAPDLYSSCHSKILLLWVTCILSYWFQSLKGICLSTCKFLSGNICALNLVASCRLLVSSA